MRTLDIAQLYLRITIGGMLILHNISKMQNYNEIISNYPNLDGFASSFWFLLFSSIESISALMLIVGWRVRFAATLLILQSILAMLVYFPTPTTNELELNAVYIFIYIYVLIAGGGTYSMDRLRSRQTTAI